ncbi:hypothetical protein NDI47_04130 [Microcoleus vaginatus GB1-A2]|uniref:hypothetical protein n=1 Tax=Microcoleus vaginatus TaxID=119532 RepID=UPI0016838899|nr:hypothetical protein [Microcoleus sp. FACHB-61]
MGESANLAIGRSTLIHTLPSNQYPRIIRSGDRLSSTPGDRINTRDLCDRAIYAIGRSGNLCDRANYPIGRSTNLL